jgi:hypothetical protein
MLRYATSNLRVCKSSQYSCRLLMRCPSHTTVAPENVPKLFATTASNACVVDHSIIAGNAAPILIIALEGTALSWSTQLTCSEGSESRRLVQERVHTVKFEGEAVALKPTGVGSVYKFLASMSK